MAIAKTIKIHSIQGIGNVVDYIENPEKTTPSDRQLLNELEYGRNPAKTDYDGACLVSGYQCDPDHAVQDFARSRNQYDFFHPNRHLAEGKQSVYAIHLVMSFPEDPDLDPRLVHQIGMEFCGRLHELGMGEYQAVVSTHVNTRHYHNHILINAYSTDGTRKFAENMTTLHRMREINDELSLKYGLPILEDFDREAVNPDRSQRGPTRRGTTRRESVGERCARQAGTSWKEQMRQDIGAVILTSESCADFRKQMEELGYTFRDHADGTLLSLCDEDGHRIRLEKLGPDCTHDAILHRIAAVNGIELQELQEKDPQRSFDLDYLPSRRIGRRTKSGRRRSDLEILFLKIISVLRLAAKIMVEAGRAAEAEQAQSRAVDLEKAMELAAQYDLERISEVNTALKDTGRSISSRKRQIRELNAVLLSLQNAQPGLSAAAILPMTSCQRQQLFLTAQGGDVRIHAKFENIDLLSAQEAINWAAGGRQAAMPAVFRRDYEARTMTAEDIAAAKTQIAAMLAAEQTSLEELNHRYKDLKFLQKNAQDARDIEAENRSRRREQRSETRRRREERQNMNG